MDRVKPDPARGRRPMAADTVLVTGIHAEELEFGDRVSDRLEPGDIEVLRIPQGVPQRCADVDQQFRYETRQRELYLQLHQQVKGRYRVLIDLHSGLDEDGPSADVYCHAPAMLDCIGSRLDEREPVRLIRIVAPDEPMPPAGADDGPDAGARTRIPPKVWTGGDPVYVGLEIYLPYRGRSEDAEDLARRLIACIRSCGGRIR